MLKIIHSTLLVAFFVSMSAQVKIPLTKTGGVYEVPCTVNGKAVNFIFDSGAADVGLSKEFYNEGVAKGIFKKEDLYSEVVNYKVANGDVVPGRLINIRKLTIGGLVLYNVLGSIIDSPNTPMLLGQTALEKFGAYSVDYAKLLLTITGNEQSTIEQKILKQMQTPGLEAIAKNMYNSLVISTSMEYEVIKLGQASSDGQIKFDIDVTNQSKLDYRWQNGAPLYYNLEVLTEDGKRYTSNNVGINADVLQGQTTNTWGFINVRNKKIVGLRVYTRVLGVN